MRIAFAIPGDLTLPTGGYAYARRVLDEWPGLGIAAEAIRLPDGFPHPDEADLERTTAILRDGADPLLIDGLAYGAFPETLAAEFGPRAAVLLHHPLCDEHDLTPDTALLLEQAERRALSHARAVIVTSPYTERDVTARFGVPADKITVAVPGTDPAPQAPQTGDPPVILAVGTVTPRKGYDLLIGALSRHRALGWRCEIVGATDRDTGETARIRSMIADAGLEDRIALRGALSDAAIAEAYTGADLFVAPSRHEGYGMAVVEAMARGLPVIAAKAGALPETAPCAMLVPPDDADALADALGHLIGNPNERRNLRHRCRAAALELPDWRATARTVADAMRRAF